MGERLNTSGIAGRDCPICGRFGSLAGERGQGAELKCTGCFALFKLHNDEPFGQLERILLDNHPPFASREEIERRLKEFDAAMPDSNACESCGMRLFVASPRCGSCEVRYQREAGR